jgi:hypothetical protein
MGRKRIEDSQRRRQISVTLSQQTVKRLHELSDCYGTNSSRVVERLIDKCNDENSWIETGCYPVS